MPKTCFDFLVWKGKQGPRHLQVGLVLKELQFHLPSKSKTELDKKDTSHSPLQPSLRHTPSRTEEMTTSIQTVKQECGTQTGKSAPGAPHGPLWADHSGLALCEDSQDSQGWVPGGGYRVAIKMMHVLVITM